jgi:hypothetical protein
MGTLYRAQILLEPEQHQALTQIAQNEGRSLSDLVREIVDQAHATPASRGCIGLGKPDRAVAAAREVVPQREDGAHVYVIPSVDTTAYDRSALIITHLDSEEMADPVGSYRVKVEATAK